MEAIIGSEYPKKVIPLIENAKQTIKIIVFDWRWYPNEPANSAQLFNQAVVCACKRGVAVSCIGNSADIVKTLQGIGAKAKRLLTNKLVHVKMILIDGKILVIGSHNFSQSAFSMNYELSVIIDEQQDLNIYDKFFNNLWTQQI